MRVGTGYDVHKLAGGRKLILGGVEIPYEKGLSGHSDADVVVHAIMDALLGAAALRDIGYHFPDSDPAYQGVSSLKLLEHVGELLEKETTYGRYYDFCASNSEEILILRYLVWFITLPLPSVIFGSIKEFGLSTNTYFTVLYTGVQEGASNYSVILPSIFGESLMIWGRNAYWVEALLVGFFVGKFCVCMERNEELSLLNVYFAVNMFIMGRGGSEAVIANMVNYMVMYFIIMKLIVKKKRRNVGHLAQ